MTRYRIDVAASSVRCETCGAAFISEERRELGPCLRWQAAHTAACPGAPEQKTLPLITEKHYAAPAGVVSRITLGIRPKAST